MWAADRTVEDGPEAEREPSSGGKHEGRVKARGTEITPVGRSGHARIRQTQIFHFVLQRTAYYLPSSCSTKKNDPTLPCFDTASTTSVSSCQAKEAALPDLSLSPGPPLTTTMEIPCLDRHDSAKPIFPNRRRRKGGKSG